MARKKPASASSAALRRYWLFKSEPESYSIQHLARQKDQTTSWDGVRNYQARNFLRDDVKVGDRVFFYHSNADPLAIVGVMEVVRAASPDPTAFDPGDHHYDPKSRPDAPTWFLVDVRLVRIFLQPVTREVLQADPETSGMTLLQKGSRLSILPVTEREWRAVHRLAGVEDS